MMYLRADEIEASTMGPQVDEVFARAKQAQFVGFAPGRLSVHLHPKHRQRRAGRRRKSRHVGAGRRTAV